MKKLVLTSFILALFLVISGNAFAAWTYKIVQTSEKNEDTLIVRVSYTNGTKTITVNIPVFQPLDSTAVHTAIKNRFQSEKQKYIADQRIDVLKPDVDADVNNSHPAE